MNSRFQIRLLLLLIVFAGCSRWEETPVISQLNVVNAYPATNSLNIQINGNPIVIDGIPKPALNYGQTSGYMQFRAGRSTLQIRNGENNIINGELFLAENRNYSLYILKSLHKADTVVMYADDLPAPEVGRAKIRFANLSPDARPLQLVITGPTGPAPTLSARTFTNFTSFATVDAAQGYTFILQRNDVPVASIGPLQLASERIYTIMAIGYADMPPSSPERLMLKIVTHR